MRLVRICLAVCPADRGVPRPQERLTPAAAATAFPSFRPLLPDGAATAFPPAGQPPAAALVCIGFRAGCEVTLRDLFRALWFGQRREGRWPSDPEFCMAARLNPRIENP
jgi:hypothetical protein